MMKLKMKPENEKTKLSKTIQNMEQIGILYTYIYIYIYDFQNFETIRSFGDSIYAGKVNLDEEEIDQTNLFQKYYRL